MVITPEKISNLSEDALREIFGKGRKKKKKKATKREVTKELIRFLRK